MRSSLSKRDSSKAFAKMVVNSKSGRVLGVHFAGAEAAEIIQVCLAQAFANLAGKLCNTREDDVRNIRFCAGLRRGCQAWTHKGAGRPNSW